MDEISIVMNQFQNALKDVINAEVRRQVSAMVRDMPVVPSNNVPHAVVGSTSISEVEYKPTKTRGPKPGIKAESKPCPVTGVLNTHRRFSYLMPEARTPENLKKFKKGK